MSFCVSCHFAFHVILRFMSFGISCHFAFHVILRFMSFCVLCHLVFHVIWHFMSFCVSCHFAFHVILRFMSLGVSCHLAFHVIWRFISFHFIWHLTFHDFWHFITFEISWHLTFHDIWHWHWDFSHTYSIHTVDTGYWRKSCEVMAEWKWSKWLKDPKNFVQMKNPFGSSWLIGGGPGPIKCPPRPPWGEADSCLRRQIWLVAYALLSQIR